MEYYVFYNTMVEKSYSVYVSHLYFAFLLARTFLFFISCKPLSRINDHYAHLAAFGRKLCMLVFHHTIPGVFENNIF